MYFRYPINDVHIHLFDPKDMDECTAMVDECGYTNWAFLACTVIGGPFALTQNLLCALMKLREGGRCQAFGSFHYNGDQVPDADTLKATLELVDPSLIDYDKETSTVSFKKDGVQIDLGGIAKGYTSSRIMDIYKEKGVTSGLVNLGGNAQVFGTKPDGSLWRVAVQSPDSEDEYLGVLETKDKAIITSGGYERYFEKDGVTYHHIIDSSTGYPADNGLISVTIVSADGTLADGLSTSLFVMGKDKATDYWKAHSDEFDMILLTDDEKLYVSEGIKDSFTSDREFEIVEK